MKSLKGIALIVFAFFVLVSQQVMASCDTIKSTAIPIGYVVSSVNHFENDLINPRTTGNLYVISENTEQIYNYRQNNNHVNHHNGYVPIFNKQYKSLISYLYSKSFLDNSKNNISLLLFQIQPNAP